MFVSVVVHHGFQFDNYLISPTLLQRLGNKQNNKFFNVFFFIYLCFSFLVRSHSLRSMENMLFSYIIFCFLRRSQKYVLCLPDFLYIFFSLLLLCFFTFIYTFVVVFIYIFFVLFVSVCFGISFHILFDFHEKEEQSRRSTHKKNSIKFSCFIVFVKEGKWEGCGWGSRAQTVVDRIEDGRNV